MHSDKNVDFAFITLFWINYYTESSETLCKWYLLFENCSWIRQGSYPICSVRG